MTEPEQAKADAYAELFAGQNAMKHAAMVLINAELMALLPGMEAEEERAADALRDATEALQKPQEAISGIEREIALAQEKAAYFRSQLDAGDAETRVSARRWLAEWDAELERLQEKLRQAHHDMMPLVQFRNSCIKDLELATDAKMGLQLAAIAPLESAAGQATSSYVTFRRSTGSLVPILLASDTDNPEWDSAVEMLSECAAHAGYRLEKVRPQLDLVMADAGSEAPVFPSGAEVAKKTELETMSATAIDYSSAPPRPQRGQVGPSAPSGYNPGRYVSAR